MNFFFIVIVYFVLYLINLTRYVFGGDSAEIVSSLSQWGIPHPPGYPLLALLGNFSVRITPLINIYQKLSFLNSLFILITSIVLFLTLKKVFKNENTIIFGPILFMILFPIWLYGLVPEVFSLTLFLISLQIYSLISLYLQPKNRQNLYKNIFLLSIGLSVTHHHLFIFFLPSYFWLILKTPSLKKIFLKDLLKNFSVAFVGILFYLYPPIISSLGTPLDVENAKTVQGFINLVTRASYGTFKAYSWAGSDLNNRLYDVFSLFIFIVHDFKPLGILFILLGSLYLIKKHKKIFYFLSINLFSICFFYFYSNFYLNNQFGIATYERFLTFLYIVLIFYFTAGVIYSYQTYCLFINRFLRNPSLKRLAIGLFYILIVGFLAITYTTNYKVIRNIRNLKIFDNFGQDILKTPSKDSLLILTGDNSLFITQNLYFVQHIRQDLTIISLSYLDRPYLQNKSNINKKIIFTNKEADFYKSNFDRGINIFSEKPYSEGVWIPYGLLWKYYPDLKSFNKDRESLVKINQDLWKTYSFPEINSEISNILFTKDIQLFYARQIWATINYYIVNNQTKLAFEFSQKYYSRLKDDYHYLLTYVSLNVSNGQCNSSLKSSLEKLLRMKIQHSIDYTPLLNYYKVCEENPKEYEKLKNDFTELKKNEEISLEKL